MSRSPVRPSRGLRLSLIVAPVLALWVPLLETFGTLSLPLVTWSSLAIFGGIAALGLTLGVAAAWFSSRSDEGVRWQILCACALAAVVLAVVDVAFGGHALLDAVTPAAGPETRSALRLATLLGLTSLVVIVAWVARGMAAALLSWAAFAAFVASVVINISLFLPHDRPVFASGGTAEHADLPPFVYIVLDEAMGFEGLEAAPGGAALSQELASVFDEHGFRWHSRAYSRYFQSGHSIPTTLNFDTDSVSREDLGRHYDGKKVHSLLFAELRGRGYEIVSYGTEHVDFCFSESSRCEVLESFNPFSPYSRYPASRDGALIQVVRHARPTSYIVYKYMDLLALLHDERLRTINPAFDVYAFPDWFERFREDVASAPRGRAYFAHFLMPHSPYAFDGACRPTGDGDVPYFLTEQHGLSGEALAGERERLYQRYFDQYRCALDTLNQFLRTLDRIESFADATIVVHGDHGARISPGQFSENLSDRQLLDNHAALYAIRAPGLEGGPIDERASIQRLTATYFSDVPPGGGDDSTVVVDSIAPGGPVLRTLPPVADSETGTESTTSAATF